MIRLIIAICVVALFLWVFALSLKFIFGLGIGTVFGVWVTYGLMKGKKGATRLEGVLRDLVDEYPK